MPDNNEAKPCIKMDRYVFNSTWPKKAVVLAGNKSTTATILIESVLSPLNYKSLLLNHIAEKRLMLPKHSILNYQIINHFPLTIRLGPLVGVLSTVPRRKGLPFGKEARLFEEMFILASRQGILMFLFYAHDIDWSSATVKGFTLYNNVTNQLRWISHVFPLPDIVYNRIRYRKIENKSSIKMTLKKLADHPNIHLFNSRFLDKWEVYQALKSDSIISHFLPSTMSYSLKNLSTLINKHSEVFLKPRNSSVGKGIIKVIKQANRSVQYQLVDENHDILIKNTTDNDLYNELKQYIKNPKDYLVQQGITLARLNDNVFDLRTQVQKDGQGTWRIIGVGVRVAANKRFLTHIPNGGQTASYKEVITYVFGNSYAIKNNINNQINTILRCVPKCLERNLKLSLAVLSIDIGIDSVGKLWIIEVNSKPASFDEDSIRHKHLKYFNDYCLFIARQKRKKEEHLW